MKSFDINKLPLLTEMYSDSYFPNELVDQIKNILFDVANKVHEQKTDNLKDLYKITHTATEKINDLQDDFYAAESEIETVARDSIAESFEILTKALGFEADLEELVATRDW